MVGPNLLTPQKRFRTCNLDPRERSARSGVIILRAQGNAHMEIARFVRHDRLAGASLMRQDKPLDVSSLPRKSRSELSVFSTG